MTEHPELQPRERPAHDSADLPAGRLRPGRRRDPGLSASVFAQDVPSALELAQRIERGICHVKDATAHDEPQMPLDGFKAGGWGRFGVKRGLAEFTQLRWITFQHLPRHYPI